MGNTHGKLDADYIDACQRNGVDFWSLEEWIAAILNAESAEIDDDGAVYLRTDGRGRYLTQAELDRARAVIDGKI